jgi:drug/metabolite transporter (DMT)-like permease
MTQTELLLALAIAVGFLLLVLTVGAFVISRQRLGILLLVLAGLSFVASLVLMSRLSSEWEHEKRELVRAKYDVTVQRWGAPLGSSATWKVDGQEIADCVVTFDDPDDPVFTCDGEEMPKR